MRSLGKAPDWRHISHGWTIPSESYSDQPCVVKTDDGAWLCAMTTGAGREGEKGQHVITARSWEEGRSWGAFPYQNRNPAWLCAGVEEDTPEGKTLKWSEPEILLYDDDPLIRMSYPDLLEDDGELYIAETQKDAARVHHIERGFLETLWGQFGWGRFGIIENRPRYAGKDIPGENL